MRRGETGGKCSKTYSSTDPARAAPPGTPRVPPMPSSFTPRCYVSHRCRFIWILVAKNASSTLRAEFERGIYQASSDRYENLPPRVRRDYFTFVFLREPVARLLSAYQEVSFRAEQGQPDLSEMAFVGMPEGLARFEAFLDEVERTAWDGHVRSQARFVDNARIDYWGSVENLQADIARIFWRIGIREVPRLPRRRSRNERAAQHGYTAHILHREEITPELRGRIRRVYREDEELYQRVIRDREVADFAKTDEELREEVARLRSVLAEVGPAEPTTSGREGADGVEY